MNLQVESTKAAQSKNNGNSFIHLRHWEAVERDGKLVRVPLSRGGLTIAYAIEGNVASFAYAKCCIRDNFNRRLGRLISSSRLTKPSKDAEHPTRFEVHGVEPEILNGKREDQQSFILQQLAQVLPEEARGDFFAMVSADPMRGTSVPLDEPVLAAE